MAAILGNEQSGLILYDIKILGPREFNELIKDCQFIAFDFETTGIDSK